MCQSTCTPELQVTNCTPKHRDQTPASFAFHRVLNDLTDRKTPSVCAIQTDRPVGTALQQGPKERASIRWSRGRQQRSSSSQRAIQAYGLLTLPVFQRVASHMPGDMTCTDVLKKTSKAPKLLAIPDSPVLIAYLTPDRLHTHGRLRLASDLQRAWLEPE